MNCEWVKSQITLWAFEELGDADRAEVEQHLERCGDCAREAQAEKQLRRVMDLRPRLEVRPALLAECRAALAEALEELPAQPASNDAAPAWRNWIHAITVPLGGFRLEWQAGLAVLLLSVGFLSGSFWRARFGAGNGDAAEFSEANIANIRSINTRADGGLEISLDTTRQRLVSGRPDDPRIQQILVYALRNYNSGIRLDSIEVLKNRTQDQPIRAALVAALRNDRNSGVRLKALEALNGFEGDEGVKKALVEVLLTDSNPGVRIKAIDRLVQQRDAATITTLQRLAEGDPNNYIRMKSASTLRAWNAPVETY